MKRIFLIAGLLALLHHALPAAADGMIVVHNQSTDDLHSSSPHAHHLFTPLEVTYHHVDVKIRGQIATTSVDEDFYNPGAQQLEGTYLFPVPKGAQIDHFTMEIGGKQVEAELLSADKARAIYEDIVRKMRDPALLEYADRDVFRVRVYPIEPHGHKRLTLSYSQVLPADSGMVSYNYPLNTEKFSAKHIKDVRIRVELEGKNPIKTIYSPTHSIEIKRDGARATVSYEVSDALPETDFALYYSLDKSELGLNLLTTKAAGEDGYFLLLASPGEVTRPTEVAARDIALVLDTSGSMAGKKLNQAKKALQFCIENLNAGDRFEVMRFSTEVEPLFNQFADATRENRDRAENFVKDLKAVGGTAIDDALQKALALRAAKSDRPFVIIFLTDGMPTVGVTDNDQIIANLKRSNENHTRIFSFGLGTDVNTHLLDRIAEESRAANEYVLPEEDIEVKVSAFFSKIKNPVLANPVLRFTGDVRVTRVYPSPLPDLFQGEQLVVAGRYSGHGNARAVIEGTVNGKSRSFTQDVSFANERSDSEFVPRLWATRRVGYLLDEIRLHGENNELRDETTELARKYGIVTPYTAYLITEDESKRNVPLTMQSMPQLNQDSAAHSQAAENWQTFKDKTDGVQGLAGARYGNTLKYAVAPASPSVMTASRAEANRALVLSAPVPTGSVLSDDSKVRLAQYSEQTAYVNGKNFFQNGKQWVDGATQKFQNAKRMRIQFNSSEYFALAAKEPTALPWLALGQNVQFILHDQVYEIYE